MDTSIAPYYGMNARGSHSFTCHPHTNRTYLYSQLQSVTALWHVVYPLHLHKEGWPGWVDLGGWLYTEIDFPIPLLPAAEHHRPLAGTYCAYPWRYGQAELTWVAGYILRYVSGTGGWTPDTVTHPSTNQARHRVPAFTPSYRAAPPFGW